MIEPCTSRERKGLSPKKRCPLFSPPRPFFFCYRLFALCCWVISHTHSLPCYLFVCYYPHWVWRSEVGTARLLNAGVKVELQQKPIIIAGRTFLPYVPYVRASFTTSGVSLSFLCDVRHPRRVGREEWLACWCTMSPVFMRNRSTGWRDRHRVECTV